MSKAIFSHDEATMLMGRTLFKGASDVAQAAVVRLKQSGRGKEEALHALMNMGAGYINVVAAMIARHQEGVSREDFNPNFAITPDVLLFSALLLNHAAPTCDEDGGVEVQFGPHIIAQTLQSFEKLTGRPADGSLQQDFVRAGREFDFKTLPQIKAEAELNSLSKPSRLN